MRLAVFGATGGLGRQVVRLALQRGHHVRAQARTPGKLEMDDDALDIVQGDFADAASVSSTLDGCDAVLSCVGYARGQDPQVYGRGMRHVLEGMQQRGIRRLVAISGAGLELAGDETGIGRRVIITLLRIFGRNVLAGKQHEWEAIRDSELDWTLVRVARMVDKPPAGQTAVDLRRVSGSPMVSYADVAEWMLDQVSDNDALVRQAPFLSGA